MSANAVVVVPAVLTVSPLICFTCPAKRWACSSPCPNCWGVLPKASSRSMIAVRKSFWTSVIRADIGFTACLSSAFFLAALPKASEILPCWRISCMVPQKSDRSPRKALFCWSGSRESRAIKQRCKTPVFGAVATL